MPVKTGTSEQRQTRSKRRQFERNAEDEVKNGKEASSPLKNEEKQGEIAKYLYNLALLNQGMLKGADLTAFINSSIENLK